jgi:hypothetical protein
MGGGGRAFDRHNAKIQHIRRTYFTLTTDWVSDGSMTSDSRDVIVQLLEMNDPMIWRPLLYVVPRGNIPATRLHPVPATNRAGPAPEYFIKDLAGGEFDVLDYSP